MKFRIARLWSPKPPRHAYPTIATKPRHAKPAALSEPLPVSLFGSMPRRPALSDTWMPQVPDFTDPAPLGHVAPLVRDQIVVMRTVVLADDSPTACAPQDSGSYSPAADTMTLDAVSAALGACDTYSALPPSQLAARVPEGDSAMQAARRSAFAEFGNSALTHTAGVADKWFNTGESLLAFWKAHPTGTEAVKSAQDAEVKAAAHDAAMADFHRRSELMLGGSAPKRTNVVGCETSIFATVYAAEFAGTHAVRNGAAL